MKAVLVNIGVSQGGYAQFGRFMPMTAPGIHYIAAGLTRDGVDVEIVNQANEKLSLDETVEEIKSKEPDVVLFNQFYSTREEIRKVASRLDKNIKKGVGGHDATFHVDNEPSYYGMFNFVWKGEADFGLAEFLRKLSGEFEIWEGLENRVRDLDKLPILTHDDYSGDVGFLVTSRGCYKEGCGFCTTPQFYPDGRKVRSVEHVYAELENLAAASKKYIFITDDNFLGFNLKDIDRANLILKKCDSLGIKVMFFSIKDQVIRADQKGYFEEWKNTIYRIHMGIESGSDSSCVKLGKIGINSNISRDAIDALEKNGIPVQLGYIMFNPQTTIEELKESGRFLYPETDYDPWNAAEFMHFRQGLRFFPGSCPNRKFDIREGEYFYEFDDSVVQKLYEALWDIDDTQINQIVNLLYTIEDTLKITGIGSWTRTAYGLVRTNIGSDNYNFFMDCLDKTQSGEAIDTYEFLNIMRVRLNELQMIYEGLQDQIIIDI
jgi:radical SAM superfamily enzyme YgiQ (UPF0313 family)